jgi:hypothetical protein
LRVLRRINPLDPLREKVKNDLHSLPLG